MAIKLIPFDIVDKLISEEAIVARGLAQPLPAEVRERLDATDVGVEDLDRLIDGVTPDNLHSEVSVGEPVGKELV